MQNIQSYNSNHSSKRECRHPCFNNYDFHSAILHLPVASEDNVKYLVEGMQHHCVVNFQTSTWKMSRQQESTPQESAQKESTQQESIRKENATQEMKLQKRTQEDVLTPQEAVDRFLEIRNGIPNLTVAAISGPGEPLSDFEAVKETFQALRRINPELQLCLCTNGLLLPVYASHLISLGVNYVTVTVNTVYPETGARIYEQIAYLGRNYSGVEGANILIQNQIAGISYLAAMGISVRMNIMIQKGINEDEIKDIVEVAKECGCKLTNILEPAAGNSYEANGLESYGRNELGALRRECEKIMPQSYFCKPCSPAAVETLGTRFSTDYEGKGHHSKIDQKPSYSKLRFAICSRNGTLTDEHFGHAGKFYIYDFINGEISFLESRPIEQYSHGTREDKAAGRIYRLIKAIEDCNCVICMRIGACPASALKEKNIEIYTTYHLIEDGIREAVNQLYSGIPLMVF